MAAELPAGLRTLWERQDEATAANPWLASRLPALSGRLLREKRPEAAALSTLAPDAQGRVLAHLAEAAVAHVLKGLGQRETVAVLAQLPDELRKRVRAGPPAWAAAPAAEDEASLAACARRCFTRAAAKGADPGSLQRRLEALLLAHAMADTHAAELRAIAMSWPRRRGERLLRYGEEAMRRADPGAGAARGLLAQAMEAS